MKLTLGFSPCPNDTFIFDALIHHKIDTEGLTFEVFFDDVETLNQKAMRAELDITKLSFHAFAYVTENYVLLDSGSALGFGVGPLLISSQQSAVSGQQSDISNEVSGIGYQVSGIRCQASNTFHLQPSTFHLPPISGLKIGIPGKYTTANFLLSLAYPDAKNKTEMLFSEIEQALIDGQIDLGLIIHENRFTYQEKGLHKVIDLGEYWEQLTGSAIPLGGIIVKRTLPDEVKLKVNRVLRRSVEYAFANPKSGIEFIRQHSQEMSEEVMYKHIELYVNKYSVELGEEGRKAVTLLFNTANEHSIIPPLKKPLFLT